jgi:hypothetical protein
VRGGEQGESRELRSLKGIKKNEEERSELKKRRAALAGLVYKTSYYSLFFFENQQGALQE